jgi:hypothetical protein
MNEFLLERVRFLILNSIDESIGNVQREFSKANDQDEFLRKNIYRFVAKWLNLIGLENPSSLTSRFDTYEKLTSYLDTLGVEGWIIGAGTYYYLEKLITVGLPTKSLVVIALQFLALYYKYKNSYSEKKANYFKYEFEKAIL